MYYKILIALINKVLLSTKDIKKYDNLILFKRIILTCKEKDINSFMSFLDEKYKTNGFQDLNIPKYIRQCGFLEENNSKLTNCFTEKYFKDLNSCIIEKKEISTNAIKESFLYSFLNEGYYRNIFIEAIKITRNKN